MSLNLPLPSACLFLFQFPFDPAMPKWIKIGCWVCRTLHDRAYTLEHLCDPSDRVDFSSSVQFVQSSSSARSIVRISFETGNTFVGDRFVGDRFVGNMYLGNMYLGNMYMGEYGQRVKDRLYLVPNTVSQSSRTTSF